MKKVITEKQAIDNILDRGTILQILPNKEKFRQLLHSGQQLKFYIGFDATAPTLHLSHAKNFMLLEKFRLLGHQVIILFGDFTARIGDPTGESNTRKQLSRQDVLKNVDSWKKLIKPLMNFKDPHNPPQILYNHDWLSKLNFEDVIKLSSNFTVQQMIERDMFQKRLQEQKPIFLHEFFYPLMQGFDSVAMEVDVELCGLDQTFNALAGRTLLKKIKNKEKYVVAVTLMENPKTGELMSKSKGTGVFLDASPFDLYGQVMAQPDEMIESLFIHCTKKEIEEIKRLPIQENPRDTKMQLALDITTTFHGKEEANKAQDRFIHQIQKGMAPSAQDIPQKKIPSGHYQIINLINKIQPQLSRSEIKRLIKQGAIKINSEKTSTDPTDIIEITKTTTIQIGKLTFFSINPQ